MFGSWTSPLKPQLFETTRTLGSLAATFTACSTAATSGWSPAEPCRDMLPSQYFTWLPGATPCPDSTSSAVSSHALVWPSGLTAVHVDVEHGMKSMPFGPTWLIITSGEPVFTENEWRSPCTRGAPHSVIPIVSSLVTPVGVSGTVSTAYA